MLSSKQLKRILLKNNGGDEELQSFVCDFYHRLALSNPNRVVNDRDLLSKHFDAFARLIVGDGVCSAAGFDYESKKLYIATNRNDHSSHRYQAYITIVLKKESTHENKILQLYLHFSIDNGPFNKIPSEKVLFRYDHLSGLMIPNPKTLVIEAAPEIRILVPDAKLRGDFTIKITLNDMFPQLLPSFSMETLDRDIEIPGRYHKIDKSLDDSFTRASESLIKLLGLHAKVAEGEQSSVSINGLDLLKSNREQFRSTIFINSMTREAEKWFEKTINHNANIGVQAFNQFIEKLNNDLIRYRDSHKLLQMSSSSIESWLIDFFYKVESGQTSCPNYIITKKDFFIKAAKRYFADIEILEKFVADEERIGGNQFIEFLKSQGHPGTKVDGLVVINTLEDNVHAEMRLLHYILEGYAKLPYISTSMLCCAHCNLAMTTHNINVSGRHGKVYGNWELALVFEINENFLKNFIGADLYSKYTLLKAKNIKFEKKTYTKAKIALMVLQKISDISSSDEIRQVLGITDSSIFNSDSLYSDDLTGEDIISTNDIVNRQEAIDSARLSYQMGLLSEPRIYMPIGSGYVGSAQQEQSNSDTVLSCHSIQYSNPILNKYNELLSSIKKIDLANDKKMDLINNLIALGEDEEVGEQILLLINELGIEEVLGILFGERYIAVEANTLATIAQIESIIGKEALAEITGWHQYISIALSNNQLSSSAIKVIQVIGHLVTRLEEWLDFNILYKSVDIENQVTIILTQLEHWVDFVASGATYVGLPPRYPDFDPDYDFGGDGFGEENEDNDNHYLALPLFTLGESNSTDYFD